MNKKTNKLICVLLVIILCIVIPFSALASTETGVAQAELLQEGSFNLPETQVAAVSYFGSSSTPTVLEYIYEGLYNCDEEIDISSYDIAVDDLVAVFTNVVNDNPDLFYVSSTIRYSYYPYYGTVACIKPVYTMSQNEISSAKIIFEQGVKDALSIVDDSMTDVQKALVLHDYVCDKAVYPALEFVDGVVVNDKEIYHSAYGFFYDGTVVCAGYALAYSYLLEKSGIQCEYMASNSMQHAWNVIKIDGKWYHVDLTYDDIGFYSEGTNFRGAMYHKCFMKSDTFMKSESGYYHFGFTTFDGSVASDTSYDDYFWNDVTTNIHVIDGYYYYPDYNSTENRTYIMKRSVNGTETKVTSKTFNSAAFSVTTTCYDENGTAHNIKDTDRLIRVTYLDNRLYVAYNKYIYSLFPNGKYYKICDITNYPVGFGVEDGSLVYQPYTVYTPVIEDKEKYLNTYLMTNSSDSYNNYPDINNDSVINVKDFALSKDIH